jgi:hypothetical protein
MSHLETRGRGWPMGPSREPFDSRLRSAAERRCANRGQSSVPVRHLTREQQGGRRRCPRRCTSLGPPALRRRRIAPERRLRVQFGASLPRQNEVDNDAGVLTEQTIGPAGTTAGDQPSCVAVAACRVGQRDGLGEARVLDAALWRLRDFMGLGPG